MSLVEMASMDELRANQPSLAEIAERRALGLDRFDEWWDGVYRIVTVPAAEHQERVQALEFFLYQEARARGLKLLPVNIGRDKQDARVPDLVAYRPDTPRTSRAFFATAELVVEVLSPGEPASLKLGFYAHWKVGEYLEVDHRTGAARLLRRTGADWVDADESAVLGFRVTDGVLVLDDDRLDLSMIGCDPT